MPDPDPAAWGIEPGYHDVAGAWHDAQPGAVTAALDALGASSAGPPGLGEDNPVWVVAADERVALDGEWELSTEDGGELRVETALPPDLPLGYHRLRRLADDRHVTLVVSPRRCPAPDGRAWGLTVQLYALRSAASWGMGDLDDLRRLGARAADAGAGFVLVNPLHATHPALPQERSPYFPSSRCFLNPLYLHIESVPGFAEGPSELLVLAGEGHRLNGSRRIDRDAVYDAKLAALELLWQAFAGDARFTAFVDSRGRPLEEFATFCALAELHGRVWSRWPEELRHPSNAAVARFATDFADRVRFHQWLQWLADAQLEDAAAAVPLVHDLAVGFDRGGADAWRWQDCLVDGFNVGAPPDEFNRDGQDWGLPPFDPWRLRLAAFAPFVETIRAGLRHGAGVRVDHVMGLFRQFWVPHDRGSGEGIYLRYPAQELLDIVALESHRAGAFVVGEDLGTVEPGVRDELARRRVLSYRLLWFEEEPPAAWPVPSLGAVTTHDLPTISGLWTSRDPQWAEVRERVAAWAGISSDASPEEAVAACHRLLAGAASSLVAFTIEDVLGVREQPNRPGTTDPTNWSMALPVPLEAITTDQLRQPLTVR